MVDKPAGMVTHPAHGAIDGTLVNALLAHVAVLPGERLRAGLVTGSTAIRRDCCSSRRPTRAGNARPRDAGAYIAREYLGIVIGVPDHPKGTIRGALGRDPRNRMKYAIRTEGKPAVTHYALARTAGRRQRIRVPLETGRTHQIRVHMAALGRRWSTTRSTAERFALPLPGQALHAWRLRFQHPRTKQMMAFEANRRRNIWRRSRCAARGAHDRDVIGDVRPPRASGGARGAGRCDRARRRRDAGFMPVGTLADVKMLEPRDLRELGARIILANTYHLWLRPGRETIVAAGGIHRFMAWDGPVLTDSGGFQVFSLESRRDVRRRRRDVSFASRRQRAPIHAGERRRVSGRARRRHRDGARPVREAAVAARGARARGGAHQRVGGALRRRAARRGPTLLFGIVQGGLDEDLRARSAAELVALDLPGYAIGGLSVGESRAEMDRVARFYRGAAAGDKPRYLMGVGTVRDLVAGIDRGIDLFDCVYPTRSGRHGRVLTRAGGSTTCATPSTCATSGRSTRTATAASARRTRGRTFRHLFRAGETLGQRLALVPQRRGADRVWLREARAAIDNGAGGVSRRHSGGGARREADRRRPRMRLFRRVGALYGGSVRVRGGGRSADPVETTFAVTVNALTGRHEVSGGRQRLVTFAPLPLGELTLRRRADSCASKGCRP